ncbi:hypothetical protein H5T51_06930 [Candidatus Bathyarchaeota archaeon]|nr:hypothetical protein [Candidatus Bathyarchaeota archaeon]
MGGKKKMSLKQMERMQAREQARDKKKARDAAAAKEKKTAGVFIPEVDNKKIVEELKKMRVLTPYMVASRFNIRISAAKDFLEKLESEGIVQMVAGNHTLKIYKVAA